mgnify:CR=1 FL=1
MKTEETKLEAQQEQLDIPVVMRSVFWQPTNLVRWKRIEIDKLRYKKVLQQLWQGDKGEQEWRDVPEDD